MSLIGALYYGLVIHHGNDLMQVYNKLNFFVKDQIYWAPASTASDLYSQLALKKYREIPRNQIK